MRMIFTFVGLLAFTATGLRAADVTTNTTTAATAAADGKKKVDIKELMKLTSFTNSTGMVLVKISPSQWVGKYEVTQEEYQKITGANPSKFSGGRNPVDSVSWNEAMAFCVKLGEAEKKEEMLLEGYSYTLPTQAEWESFASGTPLTQAVTSEKTPRASTAAVGSLPENGIGICDIRGNVAEFCLDPQDKPFRVLRGAAWDSHYEPSLRPEWRVYSNGLDDKKSSYGFRCVLTGSGQ